MSTMLRTVDSGFGNFEDDGISDIELSGILHIGNTEHRGFGIYKGQSIWGSPEITLLKTKWYTESALFTQLMMYSMIICISISH